MSCFSVHLVLCHLRCGWVAATHIMKAHVNVLLEKVKMRKPACIWPHYWGMWRYQLLHFYFLHYVILCVQGLYSESDKVEQSVVQKHVELFQMATFEGLFSKVSHQLCAFQYPLTFLKCPPVRLLLCFWGIETSHPQAHCCWMSLQQHYATLCVGELGSAVP